MTSTGPTAQPTRTPVAAAHARPDELLHVEKLRRHRIEFGQHEAFGAERLLALPQAMAPLGVQVADAQHLEGQERFERDLDRLATKGRQQKPGRRGTARAALPLHAMRDGLHALLSLG